MCVHRVQAQPQVRRSVSQSAGNLSAVLARARAFRLVEGMTGKAAASSTTAPKTFGRSVVSLSLGSVPRSRPRPQQHGTLPLIKVEEGPTEEEHMLTPSGRLPQLAEEDFTLSSLTCPSAQVHEVRTSPLFFHRNNVITWCSKASEFVQNTP
jgi:hypothetical protein